MTLFAALDRTAIGSILRSKLVFLISVLAVSNACPSGQVRAVNILPSVWTLIMRAIKCLKGVRWMPWR